MPTLTVKISKQLGQRIAAEAKLRRISQSQLVRDAIEASLRPPAAGPSPYDLIKDLVETLPKRGPKTDRSTNPKYMEGYGLDNRQYREKFGRDRRHR